MAERKGFVSNRKHQCFQASRHRYVAQFVAQLRLSFWRVFGRLPSAGGSQLGGWGGIRTRFQKASTFPRLLPGLSYSAWRLNPDFPLGTAFRSWAQGRGLSRRPAAPGKSRPQERQQATPSPIATFARALPACLVSHLAADSRQHVHRCAVRRHNPLRPPPRLTSRPAA